MSNMGSKRSLPKSNLKLSKSVTKSIASKDDKKERDGSPDDLKPGN